MMNHRRGWGMGKLNHYLADAVRSIARCYREAEHQARGYMAGEGGI